MIQFEALPFHQDILWLSSFPCFVSMKFHSTLYWSVHSNNNTCSSNAWYEFNSNTIFSPNTILVFVNSKQIKKTWCPNCNVPYWCISLQKPQLIVCSTQHTFCQSINSPYHTHICPNVSVYPDNLKYILCQKWCQ